MTRLRAGAIAALCLLLAGCFEEPVREHIHVHMSPRGPVVITLIQQLASPDVASNNPALADRLEQARAAIEQGWDRWSDRFRGLDPAAERFTLERVDGLVRRAARSATLETGRSVERFFAGEGVTAVVDIGDGVAELLLYPTGASRASSRQRDTLEQRLDRWAAGVADYLGVAIELYGYLAERPDRAVPCFSHVFDSHEQGSGPLDSVEEELVDAVKAALEPVADALLVQQDDARSLNELSRLVFDPLPARLTVTVSGELIEVEGFDRRTGFLERLPVDAWHALMALEGRWLEPDIVTAMVVPGSDDEQPEPDPVEFATRPRWFGSPPSGAEVADALVAELVPADVYSVRWRMPAEDAEIFDEVDPRQLLNAAEAVTPR